MWNVYILGRAWTIGNNSEREYSIGVIEMHAILIISGNVTIY